MVEFQPSKLVAWVRFPSLAPFFCAHSSVDRVPGYEPVGRRFESSWARQQKQNICLPTNVLFLFIQAACLAYHRLAKRGAYHQRRRAALVSHHAPACILLRLDYIQHFVLIICNSCGIDYIHAVRRD